MPTSKELDRMARLMAEPVIRPVSRVMLPRDLMASSERCWGRRDFYIVMPSMLVQSVLGGPPTVSIYPEGTSEYRAYCGRRVKHIPAYTKLIQDSDGRYRRHLPGDPPATFATAYDIYKFA